MKPNPGDQVVIPTFRCLERPPALPLYLLPNRAIFRSHIPLVFQAAANTPCSAHLLRPPATAPRLRLLLPHISLALYPPILSYPSKFCRDTLTPPLPTRLYIVLPSPYSSRDSPPPPRISLNLQISPQAVRAAANGRPAPRPEAFPTGLSREAFSLAAGMLRRLRLAKAAAPTPPSARCGVRSAREGDENAGGGGGCSRGVAWRGEREAPDWGDNEPGHVDGSDHGGDVPLVGGSGGGEGRRVGSLGVESGEEGQPMVEGFLKKRR